MNCIGCTKEMYYVIDGWVIKDGILIQTYVPFASKHQEKFVKLAICDECLEKNKVVHDKYIIITKTETNG